MAEPRLALVTGATGFIGGHLAQRLLAEGWRVRVLVREPERLVWELRETCELATGDLADLEVLRHAVRDVQVIFHCAGNVHTWDTWEAYYAGNVQGVDNLLSAILAENPGLARLVHLSTVDVYGFPPHPCDETCTPTGGHFGYGASKWQGESLLRQTCDRADIPYTVIRPGNVIGPGSQFITRIGDELKSGLMLKVGSGRAHAGMLYIDNLLDRLLWVAQAEQAIGRCYNVRDACDVTWGEFLTRFRAAIGGRGLIIDLPFFLADAVAWLLENLHRAFLPCREPLLHRLLVRIFGRTCGHSAARIRADSGLADRIGFDEALERSVDWYLHEKKSRRTRPLSRSPGA